MSDATSTFAVARARSFSAAGAVEGVRCPEMAAFRLSKSFDGKTPVLRDVSFQVYRGEAIALIGANGAGKSTLLRCCVGLTPIDSGKVHLFGNDPARLRPPELRKLRSKIGFIFQQHNLVPRLTVLSNVLHGSLARGGALSWFHSVASRHERIRAMHCLNLVGLAEFATRRADRLSGGQSQRVAIARALMQDPEIVIADEPVASLDPKAAGDVMDCFMRLLDRASLSILFTSHNLEHALKYSDRLLGLNQGVLTLDGPSKSQTLSSLKGLYGTGEC